MAPTPNPTVVEIVRFENFPAGRTGKPPRAMVRWSDGTQGEAPLW